MTDRQTVIGFMLTGILLLVLFLFYLVLEGTNRALLIEEGGLVESASALGYFFCAILIVYKGKLAYLKKYHYMFLLVIFFMLRELGFDSRFTTMGILKTKFFISNTVPLIEKLLGAVVILLFLYIIFIIIYRHSKDFLFGLKQHCVVSFGILITCAALAVSMSLDGLSRKLDVVGVKISQETSMHANAVEEIDELGIPIIIFLTFSAYFKKT
jgi:hypothetical protein